jgi:hypothetical protein
VRETVGSAVITPGMESSALRRLGGLLFSHLFPESARARLPARAWRRFTIKEGSKGPIEADFAFVRVTRARRGRPGRAGWLILRRSLEGVKEVKYFLSNAPAACSHATLVRISGWRWPRRKRILPHRPSRPRAT